jgi:hypothetical protein
LTENIRELPTIGGITTEMIKIVVMFLYRLASHPTDMIEVIAMTEAGKVMSVDCRLVNPKLVRARLPKLPVPPFGICLRQLMHVLA